MGMNEAALSEHVSEIQAPKDAPVTPPMDKRLLNPAAAWPMPEKPVGSAPTLTLGKICARIAPLSITAGGMAVLGFEPAERKGAAVLYHESAWHDICAAMIRHIQDARAAIESGE